MRLSTINSKNLKFENLNKRIRKDETNKWKISIENRYEWLKYSHISLILDNVVNSDKENTLLEGQFEYKI